jgi:prophage antirepressor-like protein
MTDIEQPTLTHTSFPVTGQPIRVVTIDGDPWFATADVCRILGRRNPSEAVKKLQRHETQTVDMRTVCLSSTEAYNEIAGRNAYGRGNQTLSLVNESGLYKLIMRSDKPAAKPFQQWVTTDLLPSIRRGDADLGEQRQRMAETLSEAIGQSIRILAEVTSPAGAVFRLMSDGTIHCRHGQAEFCHPNNAQDDGPPFGPSYRCPEINQVGIRGSKELRVCGSVKLVDLHRETCEVPTPRTQESPTPLVLTHMQGTASEIISVLREMGIARP